MFTHIHMYIYIYTCICIHTYTYIFAPPQIDVNTVWHACPKQIQTKNCTPHNKPRNRHSIYLYTYTYIHTHIYVWTYTYIYIYIYIRRHSRSASRNFVTKSNTIQTKQLTPKRSTNASKKHVSREGTRSEVYPRKEALLPEYEGAHVIYINTLVHLSIGLSIHPIIQFCILLFMYLSIHLYIFLSPRMLKFGSIWRQVGR